MLDVANTPLTIGRYALYAEIASGGMASVHFARLLGHGGFSRIVAAKRLLPHMVKDGVFTTMLMDEARLASRIRHPNVVSTLDVVCTEGELVVVMEYVHGEALSRLAHVASHLGEPISVQLASSIIIDVLHGLHAAHEATDESGQRLGVVHRDISPQNLLVGLDGVARIADFGIAKASGRSHQTRDGTIKGKLSYMAPEQIERGELTPATDVFAISIVLWELLTNRQLFDGATDAEVMQNVLICEIPRAGSLVPDIPAEYDRILERGLSRDPAQRFRSAREMALELEAISAPVRASDIGVWVGRIAADTLELRSQLISNIERSSPEDGTAFATTKPAAIKHPLLTPASVPAAPKNTSVNVSWAAGTSRRSPSWLALIAGLALALGGLSALLWMPRSRPSHAVSAAAPPRQPAQPAATSATSPPTSSTTPVASAPSTTSPAAVQAVLPKSKPPAVQQTMPNTSANCTTPYNVDTSGRRIFKLECM